MQIAIPLPDYDKSTSTEIVHTMPGNVIDENYSLTLLENQYMSLTDAVLLDRVQKGYEISKETVVMLRKRHLIKGRMPNNGMGKLLQICVIEGGVLET